MSRRLLILYFVLAGVSLGGFLLLSQWVYRIGFPLDDAWIHQAYARNLASAGEWAFISGTPSAGSTSPLWAGLLAIGYRLRLAPYIWTYLLGWATLALTAWVGYRTVLEFLPDHPQAAPWAGVLLALEWHLVWAGGSGMETLLAGLLFTVVLYLLRFPNHKPIWLGMLVGIGSWIRPDTVTLLGPIILVVLLKEVSWRKRLWESLAAVMGFSVLFIPYLGFNRSLSGTWWPNTFYAKQIEYAILGQLPFIRRYLSQLQLPMVGVGAVLLPGFLGFLWKSWLEKSWTSLVAVIWWLGYLGIYAWRLPVTYQHGRYLMPVMPIYFLWGYAGLVDWVLPRMNSMWTRVVGRTWLISACLVLIVFYGLGARSYGLDVAVIETEMVAVAKWLDAELELDATIAVHDIGAIGYYSGRDLLDLAGLVSPVVIPFIRDEDQLMAYLDEQNADYLVTFPGWYPTLVRRGEPVFRTNGTFAPALGGENLVVYRWTHP